MNEVGLGLAKRTWRLRELGHSQATDDWGTAYIYNSLVTDWVRSWCIYQDFSRVYTTEFDLPDGSGNPLNQMVSETSIEMQVSKRWLGR